MSILVNAETRVVVQGITGREGSFHTRQMLEYGTKIVAGVTPGRGGSKIEGVAVFDTVKEATRAADANTSIIYVPARFAAEAIYEAADAGISLIICITEGIPTLDMVRVYHYLRHKATRLIGPNSPGIISPGLAKVGIMPGYIHRPGPVGIISRSGTLTYEVVWALTNRGIGQSTCIGLGGDPITGSSFTDILALFQQDPDTEAIILIGEIGGTEEEQAAEYILKAVTKPVVAFIAGQSAPPEKRMGHAGAIISGGQGTAREKIEALRQAGARIADSPEQIPELLSL
jgi:succinyl-CoA synthetase alpha subunit